jgi:hypothetical protein
LIQVLAEHYERLADRYDTWVHRPDHVAWMNRRLFDRLPDDPRLVPVCASAAEVAAGRVDWTGELVFPDRFAFALGRRRS